jgi:D-galactose 1-dehydrogenase
MGLPVIKIAIVGLGKIARDQHVPALAASGSFELVAVASPHSRLEGLPGYADIQALLQALPSVSAVALCTTPQVRYQSARHCLQQGKHVLLEKPPGMTVSEVLALVQLAQQKGVTLFASWHSRHARGVEPARAWLAGRRIREATVHWKENVRVWHPGQTWIWRAGGLGVFDPGINALSIFSKIMPAPAFIKSAELIYPANRDTPIAASLTLTSLAAESASSSIVAEFDWRQTGDQSWNIDIATGDGTALRLTHGGSKLFVDGALATEAPMAEYEGIYRHFAELLDSGRSAMDAAPFQLVADAFLVGRRTTTKAFHW